MAILDYARPPQRRRLIRNRIIIVFCTIAIVVSGAYAISIDRKQRAELHAARVASLMEQSRERIRHRNYGDALIKIDELLSLDPTNEYGLGVRPLVYDTFVWQQQRKAAGDPNWRSDFDENGSRFGGVDRE